MPMEMILNDFSIDGQFCDEEQFEDYCVRYLIDVFKCLEDLLIPLYKRMDTYNRKITPDTTLFEFIRQANNPVASNIKSFLINLAMQKPYWDEMGEMRSSINDNTYECEYNDEFPNCISEAVERNTHLLSLKHDDYIEENLICMKNGQAYKISNVKQKNDLLWLYLREDVHNLKYVIEHMEFEKAVEFFQDGDICPVLQDIIDSDLQLEDIIKIVQKLPRLIMDKMSGIESHFYDRIDGDLNEYRLTISGNRELRLFFLWKDKIIFLNGGVKKQKKANSLDLQKAYKLRKKI